MTTKAEQRALRAETDFLEAVHRRLPGSMSVIRPLADLYTAVGRIEDGYRLDQEITRAHPLDGGSWYNLACSEALLGKTVPALASLRKAVEHGYTDAAWMARDPDLESLRDLPAFKALVASLRASQSDTRK